EFSGNGAFPAEALLARTGLQGGTPFNDAAVRGAERKLALFYDLEGHSGTVVRSSLRIDRETAVVDVQYQVEEGPKLVVEAVDVVSRGITDPEVIRRELALCAGQPLSSHKIGQSQYDLYRTGLFRSVGYEIEPGDAPGSRRVVFTMEESPNVNLDYGLGYSSDYGIRVSGNVGHTNVFGRRLYVGLGGRYGGEDSRAQLVVRQPGVLGSEVEGLGRAFWEEENRVNFDVTRLGLNLQATRRYREGRYTLNWGYGLEDLTLAERGPVKSLADPLGEPADPLFNPREETDVRLGSARFDAARDTRDAFLWPTSGSFTRAQVSLYDSTLLSEADYIRGFVQWNRYQKVFRSTIWNSAVRLGLAQPYGDSDYLPISERYFTGGESSLRGFRYDSLQAVGAPYLPGVTRSGLSAGGNALFLFNQELAVPVADPVHLLVFYDAGNLYWRASDFDITDLRHSAGLGVRVRTPVGPLRLEYGWKLDREEGESSGRLHFSFGMPF
ncbi:MAG: BamA/TamA family outer membrane protein, partial [Acidobacteriota bacterium]